MTHDLEAGSWGTKNIHVGNECLFLVLIAVRIIPFVKDILMGPKQY